MVTEVATDIRNTIRQRGVVRRQHQVLLAEIRTETDTLRQKEYDSARLPVTGSVTNGSR